MEQNQDEKYMQLALHEARTAAAMGEVPIGAVIVWKDKESGEDRVVALAHNTRELQKNALGHAECSAIDMACRTLGGWRLHRATLYVTLEPCPMCAGAIVNARIARVVFGAKDIRAGAFGSVLDLNAYPLNHKPEIVSGVCEEECQNLMTEFFLSLRKKRTRKLSKKEF